MSEEDNESERIELSSHAAAALLEFLDEQRRNADLLSTLHEQNGDGDSALAGKDLSEDSSDILLPEDWQLSQFWYDDNTALTLANECFRVAGPEGRVAFVSAPTAFKKAKELLRKTGSTDSYSKTDIVLLELDRRFQTLYGSQFYFYDYTQPSALPSELLGSFDVVLCDPPFLSAECLEKTALTVKHLVKSGEEGDGKVIVCTGAQMKKEVEEFFGAKPCSFQPTHRNNLANEFSCYVNYKQCPLL